MTGEKQTLYVAFRQGGQLENIETSEVRVFSDLNVAREYAEKTRGSWIIYHTQLDSAVDSPPVTSHQSPVTL